MAAPGGPRAIAECYNAWARTHNREPLLDLAGQTGGEITGLPPAVIEDIFSDVPSCSLTRDQLEGAGLSLVDLLVSAGMAKLTAKAKDIKYISQ